MRSLLAGRFAPTTLTFGFVEAPLTVVAPIYLDWVKGLASYSQVVATQIPIGLIEGLTKLDPLSGSALKKLLVDHGDGWTAYFSNFRSGSDPQGPVDVVGKRTGTRSLAIDAIPHTVRRGGNRGRLGGVQFSLHQPPGHEQGNRSLSVTAQDTASWRWYSYGPTLPFEETAAYGARVKRQRFTSEMLERYCQAIGVDPFNEAAYRDAVLVECVPAGWDPGPTIPRAVAQEMDGIVPGYMDHWPG